MKIGDDENVCPMCSEGIPSNEHRGEYPGAISRTDNVTEICSSCGELEAIVQFGKKMSLEEVRKLWYIEYLQSLADASTPDDVHRVMVEAQRNT